MDLLKSKVDKVLKSSMIFPNANWIIAYNTDIFITDVNEIDFSKDIKEIVQDNKEIVKDNKEIVKDNKEIVQDIIEIVKDNKEIVQDNKDSVGDIKEIVQDIIEINNDTITPIGFIKEKLQLYEDNEIIKTKLFNFISNQKVINKYTKRGTSLIMDGLSQDKWNVNVCKLYSFLLDVTFKYRKQIIKMI